MSEQHLIPSSEFYDTIINSYASVFEKRKKYNQAVDNYLKLHSDINAFDKILDIGSGTGERIANLFPNTSQIYAIEESRNMCTKLRQNRRIAKVFQSNVSNLNMNGLADTFDLVTMLWNVPGHVNNHLTLFNLCHKMLKSGGRLIFDVNNPFNLKSYGVKSFWSNFSYFYIHPREKRRDFNLTFEGQTTVVHFSLDQHYLKLLKNLGFKDIELKYFDYETGELVGRFMGQILIDAVKA